MKSIIKKSEPPCKTETKDVVPQLETLFRHNKSEVVLTVKANSVSAVIGVLVFALTIVIACVVYLHRV
jgi:hypothetical protein